MLLPSKAFTPGALQPEPRGGHHLKKEGSLMKNVLKKKLNRKGFTLAELLIVIAIIGVLVAVAIPVFGAQLDKAKFATDLANVRAAYAEAVATAMATDSNYDNTTGKLSVPKASIEGATKYGTSAVCSDGKITVTPANGGTATVITVDGDVTFT